MSDRPVWPDHPSDRDLFVAGALRSMPVPDHRPGFWTELDARLAAIDAERAGQQHDTGISAAVVVEVPSRFDTGEWPLAEPLPIESRRERRAHQRRVLLAVAVVALVTAGTALVLSQRADRDLEPVGVTDPTTAVTPVSTTVAQPATRTPKAAVGEFVHTIGGDEETAFAMLTAESRAFLGSATQLAAGFAQDFSAWSSPGAIERKHVMVARSPAGVRAAVVTYTGTVDIDGPPQPRTQAFAVVRERGAWRISLTAIAVSASAGPAIEMISPAVEPELECCGIGSVVTEGEPIRFAVAAVAPEIQFVSVAFDGGEPLDPAQLELTDTVVTARPRLDPGTHVVTIAIVLPEGVVYARAVQFVVG